MKCLVCSIKKMYMATFRVCTMSLCKLTGKHMNQLEQGALKVRIIINLYNFISRKHIITPWGVDCIMGSYQNTGRPSCA